MRRLVPLLAAVVAGGLVLPAWAGTSVTISGSAYHPTPVTTGLGNSVSWMNGDGFSHTATSDVAGFFNTNNIGAGGTRSRAMLRVGTFPYHCQIHAFMHGKVRVPLKATDTTIAVGSSTTLRLESAAGVTGTFSIARRRPGGTWSIVKTGVAGPTTNVKPPASGTWQYRARAKNANGSSGWSPLVQISVSS